MKHRLDNIIAYTLGVSDDVTKRPHPMDEIGQGQKVSFDKCSPLLYRR